MTLEEIEQLEDELNKSKTETLLNAIDIYIEMRKVWKT